MGCKEHCFHTRWTDDYNETPFPALPNSPQPHLWLAPSPPHSAVDCVDPQCGGHGVCVRGECVCSVGWTGVNCDDPLPACQEQCSGHGTYLPESDTCACQPNWTGPDCYTGKTCGLLFSQRKIASAHRQFPSVLAACMGLPGAIFWGFGRHETEIWIEMSQ